MPVFRQGKLSRNPAISGRLIEWPLWGLGGVLCAAFAGQIFLLNGHDWDYGVSAEALREGRWWTLITSMFIHAGFFHLAMNVSALGFGRLLLRRMGGTVKGAALFFLLYFFCGLVGGITFVAFNPNGEVPAVGASGALFGLWGAAARIGAHNEPLQPLLSKAVGRHIREAVKQNVFFIAFLIGISFLDQGQGPKLAWQAHAGGFLAGLLLVAPVLRLASVQDYDRPPVSTGKLTIQYGDETYFGAWKLNGDTIFVTSPKGTGEGRVNPFEAPQTVAERVLLEIYRQARAA